MKKALTAFAFVLFSFIYSQELGKEISISKNWISVISDQKLNLSNGKISNNTGRSTRKLSLDYYLSSTKNNSSDTKINGILIAKNPIGSLKGNNSISGISIQNPIKEMPQDGVYYQLLVLTEGNGEIKDITELSSQIAIVNGKLQIEKPKKIAEAKDTNEAKKINQAEGVTDLNKPVKIKVDVDNSISLEKEWKVNIDFKTFMVNLAGGDIANNTLEDTNDLIIDVYLTNAPQATLSSDFEGVHIAKAPLDPIGKSKRLAGTSIKTNLRAIAPQGTYYIVMTLSEIDDSGNPVVKNTKSFQNAITL